MNCDIKVVEKKNETGWDYPLYLSFFRKLNNPLTKLRFRSVLF